MKSFFLSVALLIPLSAAALKINGSHYQGAAKNLNGAPLEYWVDVEFDDEDASVNFGEVYSFMAPYKVTGTDNKATITTRMPGFDTPFVFHTNDGGSTLTAEFVSPHKQDMKFNVWLLKVPRKLKKTTRTLEETLQTLTSSDGYTCFMEIKRGGEEYCVTADAYMYADGSFKVVQDAEKLSEMFQDKLNGTFKVDGAEITLSIPGGSYSGSIYDNGNYIKIPLGRWEGDSSEVTLILIK